MYRNPELATFYQAPQVPESKYDCLDAQCGAYRLEVEAARARAASQQAVVDRIAGRIVAERAASEEANARLASARAAGRRMRLELESHPAFSAGQLPGRQALKQATRDQTIAAVLGEQSAVEAAQARVEVLVAQQREALHALDELTTALANAESDLAYLRSGRVPTGPWQWPPREDGRATLG